MSGSVGDNTARASGVIASAGGGGKILQVVCTSVTDTSSTTSTSWTDYGLSQAITPTAASSKILVCPTVYMQAGGQGLVKVVQDIAGGGYADITGMVGDARGSNRRRSTFGGNPIYYGAGSCQFLDSPSYSLSDEITYKVQWITENSITVYRNHKGADTDMGYYTTNASMLTLMEVAA